jgi:MFS transporter, putative metabolite:H+ symporter
MNIPSQRRNPAIAPAASKAQLLESIDKSRFTRRHALIYSTVVAGHLCDGFDSNLTGYILPGVIASFAITKYEAGFIGSSVSVGMLIGALGIGFVADRVGRKLAFMLGMAIYSVLSLILCLTWSYESLLVLRMVQGIGLGAEAPLVFTYLAEFMPARIRGRLVASSIFGWVFASAIAALVAIAVLPAFGWRGMFFIGGILGLVILAIAALTLPESVRSLIARGRLAEATRITNWLSSVPPEPAPADEPGPADATVAAPSLASTMDILRGTYRRYTLAIWAMQFIAGFAFFGIAVWLPSIFVSMGFKLTQSLTFVVVIASAGAVGSLVSGQLIDRLGRRNTLWLFFALSGCLMFAWSAARSGPAILVTGGLADFFAVGAGGAALYAYTSELYPTHARGIGTAWAAGCQRLAGAIAPTALGYVLGHTHSTFGFFSIIGAGELAAAVLAFFFCFEARGKSLEEISAALTVRRVLS